MGGDAELGASRLLNLWVPSIFLLLFVMSLFIFYIQTAYLLYGLFLGRTDMYRMKHHAI